MYRRQVSSIAALIVALGACGDGGGAIDPAVDTATSTTVTTAPPATQAAVQRFPDVVDVAATYDDTSGTWAFAVTISSPYDTPDRYADGWRVVGPDGTVFGVHTLAHDHADEQPFTRRQAGVSIPGDVDEVTIEGRDRKYGFGGDTATIVLQTVAP